MIPELGLIEGFFGRTYSWDERHDMVRFLAPHGYRFYLYAPKTDGFLRRRWREPYPKESLDSLVKFGEACRDVRMRFGVGLSPFELHLESGNDWQTAMADKLAVLDQAGVDDLAILFDDMRGDVADLAERQAGIVHFVAERSDAKRIICCPSYYSDDPILDSAFGRRPDRYLEHLGQRLDPAIEVMWTGEEVVSKEFSPGHLERVAGQLGRKPFLWDNYPVNDGARMSQHLHLRAFTGRPATIAPHISAHGINLASQPILSRIPALTLIENYARGRDYEYAAAFDRAAITVLGPELARSVRQDLIPFQDRGLDRLGDRRETLLARYAGFDHPAAAEICDWLNQVWAVGDALVQTQ